MRGLRLVGSKSSKISNSTKKDKPYAVTLLTRVETFSKLITKVYLIIWVETVLFSQVATILNFGDSLSIQYMFENVTKLGVYVFAFYFSTKGLENIFKGVEDHLSNTAANINTEPNSPSSADDADSDSIPIQQ